MRRGDVFWADMDPPHGAEPGKTRPVVVIQSDLLNSVNHDTTIVSMISTNVKPQPHPYRVHLPRRSAGLGRASDVLVDQTRAIDNDRLKHHAGHLPDSLLEELSEKLRTVLDLA